MIWGGNLKKRTNPEYILCLRHTEGDYFHGNQICTQSQTEAMILVSGRLSGLSGCGVAGVGGEF